jgi:hypothetical protein
MTEVIVTVFATLAFVAAVAWGVLLFRAWKKQNESRAALQAAIEAHTGSLKAISEHSATLEKMVDGFIGVSKTQVEYLERVEKAVDTFRKGIFQSVPAPAGDSFQEYDEEAASREGEIQEYMRSGMPRKEAEARVGQADIWKRMTVQR